jgi:hypothetical protein
VGSFASKAAAALSRSADLASGRSRRLYFANLGKRGRFGNQLFQIASTMGIARANGLNPVFPRWAYANAFERRLPRGSLLDEYLPSCEEKSFFYDPIELTSSHKIDGYFQSEKYFRDDRDEIAAMFTPVAQVYGEVERLFHLYGEPNCSMHVRRGDYVGHDSYFDLSHSSYYDRALHRFDRSANILVISDDPDWCRTRFLDRRLQFADRTDDVVGLFLLSRCPANVIANSSYSWWGAWLNRHPEPIVFAPERWFAGEFSDPAQPFETSGFSYRGFHDTRDLIPDRWQKLRCD